MKVKLVTAILVLAALFSVVLWRVDRFVYGNRMAWAESQARSQVSSVTQAINAEIKSGRRMLSTVTNDTFRPEGTNWRAFQPYYSLALMTSQNGAMTISRMVNKSDSPAAGWNSVQLTQYLGFLGKELESKSAVILRSFKDTQKKRHVALIFAGGGSAYILVGSGENFQALIDSQKGSMSSFSIVAADGLTISHPVPDYVGNVMSDSTLLKEVRSKGAAQGVGIFTQGKTSIFGMYEKVAGTNSYVISTVPLADLLRGRLSLAWQFVFLVLGFSLLGAALYFWNEKKQALAAANAAPVMAAPTPAVAKPYSAAPPKAAPLAVPLPPPTAAPAALPASHSSAVVVTNSELVAPSAPRTSLSQFTPAPEEPGQDKSEAYRQVASALGQEMRAPIASILGFSQMVLSKTQDPEVVQAVESILREARSSRDVLEKLHTFSGERSSEKIDGKIETCISQALKKFEAVLKDKGVAVEKDFGDTSTWPIAVEDLTKVFENIFSNAIEAMERMQNKLLKISVAEDAQGLRVLVSDSGEGIAPENLEKIFDPFYTTRSFAHHVGLGLPVVYGILKEHHADIQIKSSRGQGTQVEIHFSPLAKSSRTTKTPEPPKMTMSEPVSRPSEKPSEFQDPVQPPAAAAATSAPKLTDVNVDKLLDFSSDEMPLEFLDGFEFGEKKAPSKSAAPPAPVTAVAPVVEPEEPTRIAEPPRSPPPPPPIAASPVEAAPVTPAVEPATPTAEAVMPAAEPATPAAEPVMKAAEPVMKAAEPVMKAAEPPRFVIDDDEVTDPLYQMTAETIEEEFVAGPKPALPSRPPSILPPEFSPEPEEAMHMESEATVIMPPSLTIDPPKPRAAASSPLDSYKVEIRRPGKRT